MKLTACRVPADAVPGYEQRHRLRPRVVVVDLRLQPVPGGRLNGQRPVDQLVLLLELQLPPDQLPPWMGEPVQVI